MNQTTWTISELAREFNITPRTIRFYEDQGIVCPSREGRNRIYTNRDRTRLKLALRGRRLGFQLAEIVNIIDLYDSSSDSTITQLRHYQSVLKQHQKKLEQQRKDLDLTLKELQQQLKECQKLLVDKERNQEKVN